MTCYSRSLWQICIYFMIYDVNSVQWSGKKIDGRRCCVFACLLMYARPYVSQNKQAKTRTLHLLDKRKCIWVSAEQVNELNIKKKIYREHLKRWIRTYGTCFKIKNIDPILPHLVFIMARAIFASLFWLIFL